MGMYEKPLEKEDAYLPIFHRSPHFISKDYY